MLATQNPIEQEGTYPLPEAQVDRFMLKLKIGYPSRRRSGRSWTSWPAPPARPRPARWSSRKQILEARQVINEIYMDDKVKDYIVNLVCATRDPEAYKIEVKEFIQFGASPRATIYLTLAAKAHAFLQGRGYVTPQDVKSIGMDVLRHRVTITYEAEAEEKTSETSSRRYLTNCRCHDPARDPEEDPADRDSDQPAGERDAGGAVPQRLQGPGDELRRGARVPARGRGPHDRLERHRADEPSGPR